MSAPGDEERALEGRENTELVDADEPPVVARLVVEIRSDGTRTVARGALEDHISGERVGVEAKAGSPLELASALARMIFSSPRMARRAIDARRGETPRGRRRRAIRSMLRGLRGSDEP